MNNENLFCGRWYRPDYIDAHRSSMELQNPSQTLPTEGGEGTQRTKGEGRGKRGTEAPPDPPILADAKGGRRTEGRERADDAIVLKKKKEARQGTGRRGQGERKQGEGEAAFPIRQAWRIQKGNCRMKGEGGGEKRAEGKGGERKGDSGY